ncbi:cytochrome P450 6a9-like [Teleopsis dalmanni]|uniref:cytochrome P450 6a9-like n=1 Tax=Teleopsis dalmanni TaxID=139649 RepID=UPI0018CCD59A|nr:cytochrome P450 6a9-like [Teleopsis dalmanni]
MSGFTIFLCILVGIVTIVYIWLKRQLSYWQKLGIPCEEPSLFTGNFIGLRTKYSLTELFVNYYNKFKGSGPFAGFYWFQNPVLIILDTQLIKNILIKDFNKFTDRGFYSNEKVDPLTGQLFLLDGQKWRSMRNKLSPTFTSGKMKFMFPTIIKVGEDFLNVLNELVDQNAKVDIKELLARFTIDIIGTCAFGLNISSLRDPNTEFLVMGQRGLVETRYGFFGTALTSTFPDLARKLHVKQTPADIETFFLRIFRETVEYREKNNIRRNDFMDLLIDLKNNKSLLSEDGETLTNLTVEQLAAQAFSFFSAGFESSSISMSFALYALATHEDIQDKVRKEIETVFIAHGHEFIYDCLMDMKYLGQVILETLRLYTVVPVINRKCLEDYVVEDNSKYVIKKGTSIFIPTAGIHLDEKYYPNPNVFNPDNFSSERVNTRDHGEFLAFGEGPRNCIGFRFGLMQIKIGLALILKNYKVRVCSETQVPLKFDKKAFFTKAEGSIILKFERI